jgi:raffinose/stachyose/melibiose transport system substrate-binding protein
MEARHPTASAGLGATALVEFLEYLIQDEATEIWAGKGLLSLVDGAFEQHGPVEITPLWEAVLEAEDSLAWMENELPPGVGEDKVYNGTTEIVAGRMDAEEFTESVQAALEATR